MTKISLYKNKKQNQYPNCFSNRELTYEPAHEFTSCLTHDLF